jgi:hypothetical protein
MRAGRIPWASAGSHVRAIHPRAVEIDDKLSALDPSVQFLLLAGGAAKSGTNAGEELLRAERLVT